MRGTARCLQPASACRDLTSPGEGQAGFVLVSVLWILVLIVGLSSLFVQVIGSHLRANSAFVRAAAAEAAADGAIRLIAFRLASAPMETEDGSPLPLNGAWFSCGLYGDVSAWVSVQDQDGLVDINHAPIGLLRPVLQAGLGETEGTRLAGLIAEFRAAEADGGAAHEGASAELFALSGTRSGFHALEALLGLGGIDYERARQVAPLLTAYSRSDGIDPRSAPEELLNILGGNGADDDRGPSDLPPEFVRQSRSRVFSVTAEVGNSSTGRSVRRAIVELIRQPDQPFAVREWSTLSLPPHPTDGRAATRSGAATSRPNAPPEACFDPLEP